MKDAHIPHGKAATIGLICFVRANKKSCESPFLDLAFMLNRSDDLEKALLGLYSDLDITATLKDNGIAEEDLKKIAFYAYRDAVNMATNPTPLSENRIGSLLERVYDE